MKRRTIQSRKQRDRKSGVSAYFRKGKRPYRYPFPTGPEFLAWASSRRGTGGMIRS